MKLELIKRYLDFKIGEVFEEVSQELYIEGIRPTTPDQNSINVSRIVVQDKAYEIYEKQSAIMREK